MPSKKKIYIVTVSACALFLALLILGLTIPDAVKKSNAKKMLKSTERATVMVVIDPVFGEGDYLGNRGKSVALDEDEQATVKQQLLSVADGGLLYRGKSTIFGGGTDLRLQMQIEGETVLIFFAEDAFYTLSGEVATRFSVKDKAAYSALYQGLCALLAAAQ